jgi:hypothetical protein
MGDFDYGAEAELFPGLARGARRPPVSYRRFSRAAEAIRFAIEELPLGSLAGTALEVGEERFDGHAIRRLYESSDYPLARRERDASPAVSATVATGASSRPIPATRKGARGVESSASAPRTSMGAKTTKR